MTEPTLDGPEPDAAGLAAESAAIGADMLRVAREQAAEMLGLAERGTRIHPARLPLMVDLLTDDPQPHLLHPDWAARIDYYLSDAQRAAGAR